MATATDPNVNVGEKTNDPVVSETTPATVEKSTPAKSSTKSSAKTPAPVEQGSRDVAKFALHRFGLKCSPTKIKRVDSENLRFRPHTRESLDWLVDDMATYKQNTDPIEVVKLKDDPDGFLYKVVSGYGRHMAAMAIVEEGIDPDFELNIAVVDGSDARRIHELCVGENVKRQDYTVMDRAHAAVVLRDQHGMDKKAIATALHIKDANWIDELYKLAKLPEKQQAQIHAGNRLSNLSGGEKKNSKAVGISARAAVFALKLPDDERDKLFDDAAKGLRVTLGDVRKTSREAAAAGKKTKDGKSPPKFTLTVPEAKKIFTDLQGPVEHPAISAFAKAVTERFKGEGDGEAKFKEAIDHIERTWLIPSNGDEDEPKPLMKPSEIKKAVKAKASA